MKTLQENLDKVEELRIEQYECNKEIYNEGEETMVTKDELEALCKQINGKVIRWSLPDCEPKQILEAILLAQVDAGKVSVKPYGYSVEEIQEIMTEGGWTHEDILSIHVEKPTFCLATFGINENNIGVLRRVARLQPNELCSYQNIVGHPAGWSNPICPY